jgi:hypothetical protein
VDLSNLVRKPVSKEDFIKKVSTTLLTAPEIGLTYE